MTRLLGKCDTKVGTKLPWEVVAELDRRAHSLGISRSELIRDTLLLMTLGRDAVLRMHEQRIDSLTFGESNGGQE